LAGGFVLPNAREVWQVWAGRTARWVRFAGRGVVGPFGSVWQRLTLFGAVWRAVVGLFCSGAGEVGEG
jgi:hypothetical protein